MEQVGEEKMYLDPNGEWRPRTPIVCLCGSCKFEAHYVEWAERFTAAGYIVLTIHRFLTPKEQVEEAALKGKLDKLHLKKVELADVVLILDVGEYIGESTTRELEHALKLDKRVVRWSVCEKLRISPVVAANEMLWKGRR